MEADSDSQPELLDSLPLGAICFGDDEGLTSVIPWPLEEWRDHYPYWKELNISPRETIGDCYAMVIDTILTLGAPFPGDHQYDSSELRPELRFRVRKSNDTPDYEVLDRLANDRVVVPRVLLENEVFDISYWYAEQRSRALPDPSSPILGRPCITRG
jgi:hypothetical protein